MARVLPVLRRVPYSQLHCRYRLSDDDPNGITKLF